MLSMLAIGLGAAAFPAHAGASTLETITVPSACINPADVTMSDPPGGKPLRPNALRVNVLLPDGYDGERAFPVLYLLHGLGGAYDYWLDDSDGELMNAVKHLPAIVIMPEAGVLATYANSWSRGTREPCWEHYYLDELVPAIEQRFRILPGRRWHAIGGFSSGGLGAVDYAAKKPGYFGQVLSFSGTLSIQRPEVESGAAVIGVMALFAPTKIPAVGLMPFRGAYGDPRAQEFYWAGSNPTKLAEALSHSRIYVAHGGPSVPTCIDAAAPTHRCAGQEVIGGVTEANLNRSWAADFMTAARGAGAGVTYRPQKGGHWYSYSARFLADAIQHWGLFGPVAEHPAQWTYKTVSASGEMWDLRFQFARPPGVLETFRRDGGRLRGEGAGTVDIFAPGGCTFTRSLPFDVEIADVCP